MHGPCLDGHPAHVRARSATRRSARAARSWGVCRSRSWRVLCQKVTGIVSPRFAASIDHGGVLTLVPLEAVQSTVFPAVSPATASRALQAAVSARGRACLKQLFGSAESQTEDGSREPVFTQIEVTAPPSPLRNVRVYGLRTTAKSDFGTTGRSNYYEDFFAFVVGSTVITLNATGDPHPAPAATEHRLLSLLYSRAEVHKLS